MNILLVCIASGLTIPIAFLVGYTAEGLRALLKSKAAYWDACTREKEGKAGWNR